MKFDYLGASCPSKPSVVSCTIASTFPPGKYLEGSGVVFEVIPPFDGTHDHSGSNCCDGTAFLSALYFSSKGTFTLTLTSFSLSSSGGIRNLHLDILCDGYQSS